MKNTAPRMFGEAPPPSNENRKLLIMTGGVIFLLIALFTMNEGMFGGKPQEQVDEEVAEMDAGIAVPQLDTAKLSELVSDKTEDARDIQEEEGREFLLEYTSRLAEPHYRAMLTPSLTQDISQQVLANPDAWRGKPLRMRGYIREMRTKARPNGSKYYDGTMILDDGSQGHFVIQKLGRDDLGVGNSVRIDGILMKVFRSESGDELVEAPLVVGRSAERSFPALYTEDVGPFTESELNNIVNDDMVNGIGSLPFEEKWKLLGRAKYSSEDVNWDDAPVLDRALLSDYLKNGDDYRGMPVRLPLDGVAVLNTSTDLQGENPARIERVTDGWITENEWISTVPSLHFIGPFDIDYPVNDRTVAIGRGFFFKNLSYESSEVGLRRAPVLVLAELEELPRTEEKIVGYLIYGVAAGCIAIIAFIFLLLRRDAKSSSAFQKRLSDRKRRRPVTETAS